MIFPWFFMISNVIFPWLFNALPSTSSFSIIFTTQSINAECSNNSKLLVDRPCKNLKQPVARKLAVGHMCPTASFLATCGFIKFSQNSMIFPWLFRFFSNSMIFPCLELFFEIFQVFHDFQSWWKPCSVPFLLQQNQVLFQLWRPENPDRVLWH